MTPLAAREDLVVALLLQGVPAVEAYEWAEAALEHVRLSDGGDHLVEEVGWPAAAQADAEYHLDEGRLQRVR